MKFEIGTKDWYEIPTNPSFALIEELKKKVENPIGCI